VKEWLADLRTRFDVWRFVRASIEVNVRQACGHRMSLRLLRKGIEYRLASYRSEPCSECRFYRCMAELRLDGSELPDDAIVTIIEGAAFIDEEDGQN
jgi:hypothetical protein